MAHLLIFVYVSYVSCMINRK